MDLKKKKKKGWGGGQQSIAVFCVSLKKKEEKKGAFVAFNCKEILGYKMSKENNEDDYEST